VKASETKLQPVIEGTKQYVVPLFQRSYSWEAKEWDALWNDLVEIIEEGEMRSHFLGSVVTMQTQSMPQGVSKHLLIDGQQRLTTIFILLAALRDKVRGEPGKLADQIDDLLLRNRYQEGNDSYKLLPTQADRQAFFDVMEARGEPLEHPINKARRHFERRLRAVSASSVDAFREAIVNCLNIVSIALDPDDNPHLIFESLNAKGRPLSQADLIRNYFFMRIHVSQQESIYSSLWKPMQEQLQQDLTEYIRHFLMMGGTVVRQGDVYLALKQKADQLDAQSVIHYLTEIAGHAGIYAKLLNPEKEPSSWLRERLFRLNRIEVTVAYPFLLNVFADYANGRISEDEAADTLDVLENFLVRRFVCGTPTTGLNRVFPILYVQAVQSPSLSEGVKAVLWTRSYPRDAEFRERFATSRIYGAGDRIAKTKLILERLEMSFGHKETVSFAGLTIEHLMPQTLTEWWQSQLGDDWAVVYDTLRDTIGNLTLTAYNSPLSNLDWPSKRAILSQSHLELNRYFDTCTAWDENAIRSRAMTLADRALQIWPYFGRSQEEAAQTQDSVTGRAAAAIEIFGERIPVSTWRDVLQRTLETIIQLDEEKFDAIVKSFPRMVGADPSRMRSSRQLQNGFYVETHLSADAIYRFCIQATEMAEMTTDDWCVVFR
jgi:uncharacterized protein with ParB-like and HNH nuclease domain